MENFITRITERLNTGCFKITPDLKVSEDGSTLICGCPGEECALIFTKQDSGWVFQAKIFPADGVANGWFGYSVFISSDGNTALIGAYGADPKGTDSGAAYIYTRSGSTWTQQAKLFPADGVADDRFGVSVSLSSDGNTALIGAYRADPKGAYSGAAYIYTRSGSTWTQQAKLFPADGVANDRFGYSVSISSDGSVIKIRNIHNKEYTFTRVDNKWTETTSHQADKSSMSNEKDNDQRVLTTLQSLFISRVPYDLWVLLNNIIYRHTGIGEPAVRPQLPFTIPFSKELANELTSSIVKLQSELGLKEEMVREMVQLINSKAIKTPYNQPSQGFFTGQHQQQPMTPPFNTPFSLPPGMWMPPPPYMYPGAYPQYPGGMTPPWQQPNNPMQASTETLRTRKRMELEQLNNELTPLQHQLGLLQERVKYLQAKIKAIEAIPEE